MPLAAWLLILGADVWFAIRVLEARRGVQTFGRRKFSRLEPKSGYWAVLSGHGVALLISAALTVWALLMVAGVIGTPPAA